MPEDYDSDSSPGTSASTSFPNASHAFTAGTEALLAKLNGSKATQQEPVEDQNETKIIFCSRTHSQIGQFANELRRVRPPPSIVCIDAQNPQKTSQDEPAEPIKHLTLGSRKNLCRNAQVTALGSTDAINERCLDLQKPKVPADQRCPYLPKDNREVFERFRDYALAEIHDIEDLGSLGESMKVCPYYASRAAVGSSEILTLPYPLLLQKSARESLNISVKGHVVIIDEAHNLLDAIADSYSCSVSLVQLEMATSQLMAYLLKFKARLKDKNRVYVTQTVRLLDSVSGCLRHMARETSENEATISINQLLSGKGVDQIQPHTIIRYLQESKLAFKVENYRLSQATASSTAVPERSERGALQAFNNFLAVLMNPSPEGQFFFTRDEHGKVSVRYLLLDPREHFRDIVEEARAVILAGGTMTPMSHYKDFLFSYLPPERLKTFSFGHVIPREHLFTQPIGIGPTGVELDFTFEKRKSEKMITELGLLFIQACSIIPDGVVAFFPSYDYLAHVVSVWRRSTVPDTYRVRNLERKGHDGAVQGSPNRCFKRIGEQTIFAILNAIKPIFYETRSEKVNYHPGSGNSGQQHGSASLLTCYTQKVTEAKRAPSINHYHAGNDRADGGSGALLLSVTSGSLSEGINFSDSLGRAIFAIGLPFPNPHSATWKAKLRHVERSQQASRTEGLNGSGDNAGTESSNSYISCATTKPYSSTLSSAPSTSSATSYNFALTTTLRATNQSVGRAIRHRHDYAAILLIDRRFASAAATTAATTAAAPSDASLRRSTPASAPSLPLTIWTGLPSWIRDGYRRSGEWGESSRSAFYESKPAKKNPAAVEAEKEHQDSTETKLPHREQTQITRKISQPEHKRTHFQQQQQQQQQKINSLDVLGLQQFFASFDPPSPSSSQPTLQ